MRLRQVKTAGYLSNEENGPGSGPGPFYEKMGFVYTGEAEDGELWMRRAL
jgi:hypothetical protein